jgi:hypothetical protein
MRGELDPKLNFFENDQETLEDFVRLVNFLAGKKYSVQMDWSNLTGFI